MKQMRRQTVLRKLARFVKRKKDNKFNCCFMFVTIFINSMIYNLNLLQVQIRRQHLLFLMSV